ncbi:hypothetical protein F4861DRAFT_405891 [Xylaria intraflava]|nr:hypothetical protein F4861DRAFT_405891 [Xylaria intraflava]
MSAGQIERKYPSHEQLPEIPNSAISIDPYTSCIMDDTQDISSRSKDKGGNRRGDTNFARRVRSHSVRRRNTQTSRARSASVGSLDRLFDTHSRDGPSITFSSAPVPTAVEQRFIDETHGVNEVRDGFFEAVFLPPEDADVHALMMYAEETLPLAFEKNDPLSISLFFPTQYHAACNVVRRVTTTRSGIKLLKSFLGFFIAYILCLIPKIQDRFGRYVYIMAISAILNHPGRSLGAQVDGTLLTILGTATGLGWGAFGLWLSTITAPAQIGFGAILGLFLFIFIFVNACLRSYFTRIYQLVICAGIAISYTCLAEVSATSISWNKLLAYGIPWLMGQAVSLVVCVLIAPDAGSRPLAVGMHQVFDFMVGAIPPVTDSVRARRRLAQAFVSMSQVYRDLVMDFSITTLSPQNVLMLRNSIQAVVRALLSLRQDSILSQPLTGSISDVDDLSPEESPEFIANIGPMYEHSDDTEAIEAVAFVTESLAAPMKTLLRSMKFTLQSCDAALMDMCGHRRYLGPSYEISNDVHGTLIELEEHITAFYNIQEKILGDSKIPLTYLKLPGVVKIFAYCRPIHQAASSIRALATQVDGLQQGQSKYPRFHAPSYPFIKAMHRTNAQVRHDRGGVTAGSYFRNLSDIAGIIEKIRCRDFHPISHQEQPRAENNDTPPEKMTADDHGDSASYEKTRLRYRIWTVLHRMQGFETRFGLKTALVISLLALPAYLDSSHAWWDYHQVWWTVVMAWLMMGPRTGGNIQDLFTRVFCAVLGSLWAGLSYAAGNGNPYVMAVFAAIFMLPMMYRYTQSTHPRSGLVGCISFTFVSLSAVEEGPSSVAGMAATRGVSIIIGVTGSIIMNWVLWPFVARHDLRKGIASMIFNCSILYRSTMSRYVYYDEGNAPTDKDIQASEILEGRLREGFVRLRELLGLTRHEVRLRAPFDPLPYSALISSCESLFEYIIRVRQSSLFYHPHFIGDSSEAAADLFRYRRDEMATVMTNLYILSLALRVDRPVPKYLPSVAAARQIVLNRMLELEKGYAQLHGDEVKQRDMRLAQIYYYSYTDSLTGCMEQVRQLEKYTKLIVGEKG